jgi:hypothetical protein
VKESTSLFATLKNVLKVLFGDRGSDLNGRLYVPPETQQLIDQLKGTASPVTFKVDSDDF